MSVEAFLARRRTWRWNRGSSGGYDAVEATEKHVVWYRWSHEADGGRQDVAAQSAARFKLAGAPRDMQVPASVLRELREWLDAKPDRS